MELLRIPSMPRRSGMPEDVQFIVGVDCSLKATGLVRLSLSTGKIQGKPKDIVTDSGHILPRLDFLIKQGISQIPKDSLVLIEDHAYSKRFHMADTAAANTIFQFFCWKRTGRLPVAIAPTALRKFICGDGKADKAVVIHKVFKRFSIEWESTHLAEAFALAMLGLLSYWEVNPKDWGLSAYDVNLLSLVSSAISQK